MRGLAWFCLVVGLAHAAFPRMTYLLFHKGFLDPPHLLHNRRLILAFRLTGLGVVAAGVVLLIVA